MVNKERKQKYLSELNSKKFPRDDNKILIRGWVRTNFRRQSRGEFYEAKVDVKRWSGTIDSIRVFVPCYIFEAQGEPKKGQPVEVMGQIYVYGKRSDQVALLANSIFVNQTEKGRTNNIVYLKGKILRKSTVEHKNSGTSVTEFTLSVERDYGVADEIHCVAWNGTALYVYRNFDAGDMIKLHGRFQSGTYFKPDHEDPRYGEYRQTYEVAIAEIL